MGTGRQNTFFRTLRTCTEPSTGLQLSESKKFSNQLLSIRIVTELSSDVRRRQKQEPDSPSSPRERVSFLGTDVNMANSVYDCRVAELEYMVADQ